jgi:hypothetical protein
MLSLNLLKNFKHKYFFFDHILVHVITFNVTFNQCLEANVDCVIIDPIQTQVK